MIPTLDVVDVHLGLPIRHDHRQLIEVGDFAPLWQFVEPHVGQEVTEAGSRGDHVAIRFAEDRAFGEQNGQRFIKRVEIRVAPRLAATSPTAVVP
jgi:hypothetical protein